MLSAHFPSSHILIPPSCLCAQAAGPELAQSHLPSTFAAQSCPRDCHFGHIDFFVVYPEKASRTFQDKCCLSFGFIYLFISVVHDAKGELGTRGIPNIHVDRLWEIDYYDFSIIYTEQAYTACFLSSTNHDRLIAFNLTFIEITSTASQLAPRSMSWTGARAGASGLESLRL